MTTLTLEDYSFSYSRSTGKMRFRLLHGESDSDILVNRLVGQWWVQGVDRLGNIKAECALGVEGETAYVYHPDIEEQEVGEAHCDLSADNSHDHCHVAADSPFPQGRDTHWRICFARELADGNEPCWRLRDERTDELWFVQGYEGPMNVNYFDKGSHIFADGPCSVDENMIAHFGGSHGN